MIVSLLGVAFLCYICFLSFSYALSRLLLKKAEPIFNANEASLKRVKNSTEPMFEELEKVSRKVVDEKVLETF